MPSWSLEILPQRGWFDLRLGELWQYRELVGLLVWRDFVLLYKQTVLGWLWYVIQPLLTTLIYVLVFGRVAKLSTDGMPQLLFYLAGTINWNYFQTCLTKISNTFISNAPIFGKVYFPRLVMPLAVVIASMISWAIQFGLFLGFLVFYLLSGEAIHPSLAILLTPLLVLIMAALGLGLGIIVASLTIRYRDLHFLLTFGVQLFMYATPVIYPISSLSSEWQSVLMLNPIAAVMEAFRYAFLGAGVFSPGWLLYSAGAALAILFLAVMLFTRLERNFMDTV